jgi:serine/threonine-protein phosphatase 2A regulatory subunit B'
MQSLSIDLIKGLLKFWPLTCPAKEVIYISEIEEVLDMMGTSAESKFSEFGPSLLKRLILTSQGMHYQAAERSLLLLNSDHFQKIVKANMSKAYPIIVKGLLNSSQTSHWNQTVTTITYSVIRTYMEINREQFEKLTQQGQQE